MLTLFLSVAEAISFPNTVPSHNIRIEFDLKTHTIDAVDRYKTIVMGKHEITFFLHKNVSILEIRETGGEKLYYFISDDRDQKKVIVHLPPGKSIIEIEIHYNGRFPDMPEGVNSSREFISDKPVAYAGEDIILLDGSACWYPCVDSSTTFNLTAVTPTGYEVVMEGTRVSRNVKNGITISTWDFPHPAGYIFLVGGKYVINEDNYNNIAIYTYFFPEDTGLAQGYMDYSKKYLELYEGLFGKYPFRKFAVVENILPTGFGMPSFTLLGQTVLRLPFMVKTSLGHEIAHNWWGNYVYPDYKSGNWSEGLTTYVADYLYDEMEGNGVSYRNQLLRDYTNYTDRASDYPLTRFVRRENPADRAIGYGKGAYVFHMLRVMLGDEIFYKGLRDVIAVRGFKAATWNDFRLSFEKVSGRELRSFFRQWVEGAGAPQITLGDVRVFSDDELVIHPEFVSGSQTSSVVEEPETKLKQDQHKVRYDMEGIGASGQTGYSIKADIIQGDDPYELYLPVLVETEKGSLLSYHWISKSLNTIEVHVSSRPVSITFDPDYNIFRRLNQSEVPPTIGRFTGAKEKTIIAPAGGKKVVSDAYLRAAALLEGSVKFDDPVLPSLIKIGEDTVSVGGKVYDKTDAVLAVALDSPYNKGAVVLFITGERAEDIVSVGERLVHYGKYSYLLFVKGENVEKGIWEAEKLRMDFHDDN